MLLYNKPVYKNITHLPDIMEKVNNLPSVSLSPSLLADIIQARMNIKKIYLKTSCFETESLINKILGSIINPLNKIRGNIDTRPLAFIGAPVTNPTRITDHNTVVRKIDAPFYLRTNVLVMY